VEREIAGVGFQDHLARIVAVIEEVQLAEQHAHVEHRLGQAPVEQVAQRVDVPAQARVARAGQVDELVHHHAVLLLLTDASFSQY